MQCIVDLKRETGSTNFLSSYCETVQWMEILLRKHWQEQTGRINYGRSKTGRVNAGKSKIERTMTKSTGGLLKWGFPYSCHSLPCQFTPAIIYSCNLTPAKVYPFSFTLANIHPSSFTPAIVKTGRVNYGRSETGRV